MPTEREDRRDRKLAERLLADVPPRPTPRKPKVTPIRKKKAKPGVLASALFDITLFGVFISALGLFLAFKTGVIDAEHFFAPAEKPAPSVPAATKQPPKVVKKPAPPKPSYDLSGRVTKVTDGDTITIRDSSGREHKIRFHGIDTPEMKQRYGKQAKKALSKLVSRKQVGIKVIDTDRYGRTVGVVFVDGKNINLEMVCAGHAWWYERYAPNNRELKSCHKRARSMGIGLWKQQTPMPPWEYRRTELSGLALKLG